MPFFQGPWYEVQHDWLDLYDNPADVCAVREYSESATGEATETRSAKRLFYGSREDVTTEFSDHIVDTDYENYAILYECSPIIPGMLFKSSAIILSRETTIDEANLEKAKTYLVDNYSYSANLALISVARVGCNLIEPTTVQPSSATSSVTISTTSVTITWPLISPAPTKYNVNFLNSEGESLINLDECSGLD
eukprot:CAMPEP_0170488524 /NCGR_PEP_ID=MMETSP0208-20121228/7068_1 /TAXON_ID=197538 /ORGANISM="Strombidium inclinatum, Strain S3" /LENGTH=192 /DNA_ID=CAMNT_0010763129 /DNA_START=8 /DNA_END=586 /DNA_ORIENTATION=+